MSSAWRLLLPLIVLGFSASVLAEPESCLWHLTKYFKKRELKKIDPSDRAALQNLLRKVYENPRQPLGAEERSWVERYSLHGAVDTVRAAGEDVLRTGQRHHAGKVIVAALGGSGLAVVAGQRGLELLGPPSSVEDDLNRRYGLSLHGNSEEELKILKKVFECNPQDSLLQSRIGLRDKAFVMSSWYVEDGALVESIKNDLRNLNSASQLTSFLLYGIDLVNQKRWTAYRPPGGCGTTKAYDNFNELMRDLVLRYDLPLCTRWGTPSASHLNLYQTCQLAEFLNVISPDLRNSMRGLKGIVRVDEKMKPVDPQTGIPSVDAYYQPSTEKIETYTNETAVLLHEIGHRVSHSFGPGADGEWIDLNFKFVRGKGMLPREDRMFPSDYAKAAPEECWAEYFSGYFANQDNRHRLRTFMPEQVKYLEKFLRKRGMQPLD